MAKNRRRAKGDGALFQRKDGRWQGEVFLGYDGEGRPRYKAVTAKMQAACREKLEQLKKQRDAGTLHADKLTMTGYLERWLETKARQVKERTLYDYRYNAEKYVMPRIGGLLLVKVTPLVIQDMLNDFEEQRQAALGLMDMLPICLL